MVNYIQGPVLIPGKKILRGPNAKVDDYHYVVFSRETIIVIREKFHQEKKENNLNIEHNGILLKDIYLTKSFILDDTNIKLIVGEFKDLPIGTWIIEYRIENENVWKMIQDKIINGFSIEGTFNYEEI